MVLLHYHVVPGLGDDTRPRPEATAARGDQAALADCDDLALEATHADSAHRISRGRRHPRRVNAFPPAPERSRRSLAR